MNLEGKKIGFVINELFDDNKKLIEEVKKLIKQKAIVIPIISINSFLKDIEESELNNFINKIEDITGIKVISKIQEIEELNSKDILDILVVVPATGNIIAKLANDIIDEPVTIAVNHQLIREKPIVIGIFANDGLLSAGENIGKLLNRKNYFFVPFKQSNPITKPYAITFDFTYLAKTIIYSLNKEQIQPILLSM